MTPMATLEETLAEAVATGKLGSVVSVRAMLHLPGEESDLETAASVVLSLSGRLVGSETGSLVARGHGSGRQLNLLLRLDAGPIVSLSLTRGSVDQLELALVVVGGRGSAIVVWAAVLGFTSDCLRSNGPLGLDLVLATVAVCLLPSEWTRRRIHSITTTTLTAVLLTAGIESASRLVRIGIVSPNSAWLTDTLPAAVTGSLADALVSSGLLLIVLLGLRGLHRSLGRMLLPAPLST